MLAFDGNTIQMVSQQWYQNSIQVWMHIPSLTAFMVCSSCSSLNGHVLLPLLIAGQSMAFEKRDSCYWAVLVMSPSIWRPGCEAFTKHSCEPVSVDGDKINQVLWLWMGTTNGCPWTIDFGRCDLFLNIGPMYSTIVWLVRMNLACSGLLTNVRRFKNLTCGLVLCKCS